MSRNTWLFRLIFIFSLYSATFIGCGGGGTNDPVPTNTAPVADAGPDQAVTTGATVSLSGTGTDADQDSVTYSWTLTPPNGSSAALSSSTSQTPTFIADMAGTYTVSLIVNDGTVNSATDSVTITVTGESLVFQYPPVDLDKVEFINPLGGMIGNHVTPIDHQYYVASDFGADDEMEIDVYSPAGGTITSIQHMGSFDVAFQDYRVVIQHTSAVSSIYIHIDYLSEKIMEFAPTQGGYASTNISVVAGEVIGTYTGSVDYNVVDNDITLTGFVVPESYNAESWKIHTPDPFDYFSDSIKAVLLAKCMRTDDPPGGKIDYDIDGRMVGNWFLEGTNGYGGANQEDYWVGHLALAYDWIDSDHIIVSMGDYNGEEKQYGVVGNTPDPADVSTATGMVTYELVSYDYYDGASTWDRATLVQGLEVENYTSVHGVILLQLVEDRRLKVEIFPNETAQTVTDFTENALFYVR